MSTVCILVKGRSFSKVLANSKTFNKSIVNNNLVKALEDLIVNIIYTNCLGTELISLMKTMIKILIFHIIIKY